MTKQSTRERLPRRWRFLTWFRLLVAGWRPNRNVWSRIKLPKTFPVFPAARSALTEYGGLRFGDRFDYVHLDPNVNDRVSDEIKKYEKLVGHELFPLGVWESQEEMYLLIDQEGIVYMMDYQLRPLASSIHRAMEYIVRRVWSHQGKEADLATVDMVGKVWRLPDESYSQW